MSPTTTNSVIVGLAVIIAGVGIVDAAIGGQPDLVVVFVLLAILLATLFASLHRRRPAIPIRADLVRWLRDRSAVAGEDIEVLADRCIASYRAELTGDRD